LFDLTSLANAGLRKRYIFSFILVSIIPIFLILLFLYIPIVSLFKNEVINTDLIKSRTIKDVMDMRVLEIQNLSIQIGTDKRVKEFFYRKSPLDNEGNYYIKDISDLVQSYKVGNNFISLIAIYLIQSSSVVTHEGKYNSEYFFKRILKYENMDPIQTKNMMTKIYYSEFFPLKKINGAGPLNGKYITYVRSLPIGESNALANVMIFIDEKNMLSMMGETNKDNEEKVTILNKDYELISSKSGYEGIKQLLMEKAGTDSDSFITDMPDGTSMVVSYNKSQVNDWIYVVFSSMDNIVSRINNIRDLAIIIAMLTFVVGILLSLLMAGLNYKPWMHLMKQIKTFYDKPGTGKCKNEYLLAMDAFESMRIEKEQLQSDMEKSKNYIKKYVLQNLCAGKKNSADSSSIQEIFPYKFYCVIIVDIDGTQQLPQKISWFLSRFVSLYYNNYIIYTFEDEKQRLCIVLNTSVYGTELTVKQIKHLQEALNSHFNVLLYTGIGCIYDDMGKIYTSHKEAVKSLEYCILKGKDSVVFYPDIEKYIFCSLNLPINSDNPLLHSVKVGDLKNCTRLLDEYFNNIINLGNVSVQYMYCLFYNFISVILKACDEIHVDFKDIFGRSPEQILDIDRHRNSRQIIDSVYEVYMVICNYINNNKITHNNSLKKQIEAFLDANYTDKNMSLVELADKLGYSSSYLSRFIKQEFGVGFGEFLNKMRITAVKQLLATSMKPIGDISEALGYTSINSFTRAFKREEGITPTQYRNITFTADKNM